MMTVFSGADKRPCADFAGDEEVAGRTALPACAQQGEHWQQRVAAKTADKRITGFTAGRLFAKLRDLGYHKFRRTLELENGPRRTKEPRDLSQISRLRNPQFRDVPLVHCFRGQKIHHMPPQQVNISLVRQKSDNSDCGVHSILCS
jgi:hypothetical protein